MLANLFGPSGWNAIATRSRLGQRLNWKNSNFNFQSQRKRNTQTTTTTNSNKQHICKQAETNQLCSAAPPFKIKRWESQRARESERACVKESACGELDEERKVTAMAWYWILVLTRQNWSNNYKYNNSKDLSLKPVWQSFFAAGKACVKSLLASIEQ